jgi:hypothetical protein
MAVSQAGEKAPTSIATLYYQPVLERIRQLPGVQEAALISCPPLSGINMNTSFEGSNLVVQNAMQSGARRIQATFDAGFAGCGAQVRFGKEGGGELRHRTMDGKMCNIISTDVSGTTCSIRKGNLVGGG